MNQGTIDIFHTVGPDLITVQDGPKILLPGQAVKAFLDRCKTLNTRLAYTAALNSFFSNGCPNDLVIFRSLVTTENIQKWIKKLEGKGSTAGKSQSTVVHRYSILKQFLEACTVWGLLQTNPAHKYLIQPPESPEWEPSLGLMTKDILAILETCKNDPNKMVGLRDRAIIMLGFTCCLRVSEIHYCNTNDVVRYGKKLRLNLKRTKRGVQQKVDLAESVKEVLEDYIVAIGGYAAMSPDRYEDGSINRPVFVSLAPSTKGNRLSVSYIGKMIKRRGKEAGIDMNVHSHMLRHSGITHLFEMGWQIADIQRHARHKDIKTTMRYRDLWEDYHKASAADALSAIF